MTSLRIAIGLAMTAGIAAPWTAFAAPAASPTTRPTYVAPRCDMPITIDGKLDEPAWQRVPESAPFVPVRPDAVMTRRTTLRMTYDDTTLYVGVRCDDPNAHEAVLASPRAHDDPNIWRDDSVEVFFDPAQCRALFDQFIVSIAGRMVYGRDGNYEPDTLTKVAVHVADDAWFVELAIPFERLGVRAHAGDMWGMDVFRSRHARSPSDKTELSAWSPTGASFRLAHKFGNLLFAVGPTTARPKPDDAIADRLVRVIQAESQGQGRWTTDDLNPDAAARRAAGLLTLRPRLQRLAEPALLFARPAIRNEPILPWTVPAPDELDLPVDVRACHDEFEPATFAIFATRDLTNVAVRVSEFIGENGRTVDPALCDVRWVVCWYQGGWGMIHRDGIVLVPELLVKDPTLVALDTKARANVLKFKGYPTDAETLQPVDVPAFTTRQVWLTVRVPTDVPPGDYRATITVTAGDDAAPIASLPMRLHVYPFELEPSPLKYSLYYRLRFNDKLDPDAVVRQMTAEIRNQIEHGINMPSTYVGGGSLHPGGPPFEKLDALTRIYRDLGLRDHPLILVTTAVGKQSTPEQLDNVRSMVRRFVEYGRANGYSDVYFQGIDEGGNDTLRAERQSFAAVHDAGGKVFVACSANFFDTIGDLLDMPVVGGDLRPELARKVRANGFLITSYANPQTGTERPETYRRNYGLRLWAAGYDGAFDYEYATWEPDRAWTDLDEDHYRDHTMAYPTGGKPIDTIQWEGWREGVDDVRYVATLMDELRSVPSLSDAAIRTLEVAARAQANVPNLDAVRVAIAANIIGTRAYRERQSESGALSTAPSTTTKPAPAPPSGSGTDAPVGPRP